MNIIKQTIDNETWRLNENTLQAEDVYKKTHCGTTARYVIKLLTQIVVNDNHTVSVPHDEIVFFLEQDTYNKQVVLEKVRSIWPESKHQLFYITLCGSAHTFVIEKMNDEESSQFRIYQSWQGSFTLASWLGCDTWVNETCRNEFEEYGKGQWISLDKMIRFLEEMLTLCRQQLQKYHEWGFYPSEVKIIGFCLKN